MAVINTGAINRVLLDQAFARSVDHARCVDKPKRRMRDPEVAALVNCIHDERMGQWVREPSPGMPELAEFDTLHVRDMAGLETPVFVHLVLSLAPAK